MRPEAGGDDRVRGGGRGAGGEEAQVRLDRIGRGAAQGELLGRPRGIALEVEEVDVDRIDAGHVLKHLIDEAQVDRLGEADGGEGEGREERPAGVGEHRLAHEIGRHPDLGGDHDGDAAGVG